MELGILERIILMQILPNESNYLTYKVISDLRSDLSFNEEEIALFELTSEDSNIKWNSAKEEKKYIDLGPKALDIIRNELKKLNDQNKINASNYGLYEKFLM